MLYAANWRAAKGMGYRRTITYTDINEIGTSLIAAGYKRDGTTRGGPWDRIKRRRDAPEVGGVKQRWKIDLDEAALAHGDARVDAGSAPKRGGT